jgi:hypothetical protein
MNGNDCYYELQIKILSNEDKDAYIAAANEHNNTVFLQKNVKNFNLLSPYDLFIPKCDLNNQHLSVNFNIELGCVIRFSNNTYQNTFIKLGPTDFENYFINNPITSSVCVDFYGINECGIKKYNPILSVKSAHPTFVKIVDVIENKPTYMYVH